MSSPPRSTKTWRRAVLAALGAAILAAAACTPVPAGPAGEASPAPGLTPAPSEPAPTPTPEPLLSWGPTEADLTRATADAAALSDEELTGLLIVARYEGTDPEVPARLVADLHLGGVILFGPNIAGLSQVQQTAAAVQEAHAQAGRDWPAIIAVDNEGGRVQRLSGATGPWTTFPPFAAAGGAPAETIREGMAAMARELRASGVNTNYAPVADITGPGDAAIGDRAAGTDPDPVAEAVGEAVAGFLAGGVAPAIKHFPGHGGLPVDSHVGLPVQDATTEELRSREYLPFQAGIDAGAPMVMMGHIAVSDWQEGKPASLSARAYDQLRTDLGFTGVAITDGLDMGALAGTSAEIAVAAITAGADILLTPVDPHGARAGLLAALAANQLSRQRLEEAGGRIIAMMRHQQEIAERAGAVSDDDVGAAVAEAAALAG